MPSFKILSVDMSYRGAGICSMAKTDSGLEIIKLKCLKNESYEGMGFNSIKACMQSLYQNTVVELDDLLEDNHDAVIIEMPCFTQSAKSSLLIGMCWGIMCGIDAIFVEPSAIKKWSHSRRGDKKGRVKEKVLERVFLDSHQASDDNIVDAVALSLMFVDKIAELKYEYNTTQR